MGQKEHRMTDVGVGVPDVVALLAEAEAVKKLTAAVQAKLTLLERSADELHQRCEGVGAHLARAKQAFRAAVDSADAKALTAAGKEADAARAEAAGLVGQRDALLKDLDDLVTEVAAVSKTCGVLLGHLVSVRERLPLLLAEVDAVGEARSEVSARIDRVRGDLKKLLGPPPGAGKSG